MTGAGLLLTTESIKWAIERGYRTLDLLAPADEYKLRCAEGAVDGVDWAVPFSVRGAAFVRLYLGLLRPALKRQLAAEPARLQRFLARLYYRRSGAS